MCQLHNTYNSYCAKLFWIISLISGQGQHDCVLVGELKRERDFYRTRGLTCPKDAAMINDKGGAGDEPEQPDNTDCHRKDEQVCKYTCIYYVH